MMPTAFFQRFKRSARGNLWCEYEGLTLSVFKAKDRDDYVWCIGDDDGPHYSPREYPTERAAVAGIRSELRQREMPV